ncbi:hypothetical protein BS78_K185100 [Paspalum vaginatum]|uniref:Myb/SANT-like domain-containing protein n=1 Tax=Paspalum vaginatum TaxID=158149 RepID=A0A9W7XAW0_9POAL|nr:hypothetical protein BS78_K185100 [Paspalum vaginatum]
MISNGACLDALMFWRHKNWMPAMTGEKTKSRANWSDERTKFLVFMMEYHLSARHRGQNGWTKEGWNSMATRLNNKYPVSKYTVGQLKDREQRLKKDHNTVKSIVSKSGFGWNPEINMVTAINEKWEELSDEQQKWKNKSFPYYDDLYDIYDGKVAEGKRCRRTTDWQPEKQQLNSSSQEDNIHETDVDFVSGSIETARKDTEFDLNIGFEDGLNTTTTNSVYGDEPEISMNPSSNREETKNENPTASGRNQRARPTEKGLEKNNPKRNRDGVLESLVALQKEELESYKELKSKQIESYKEVKLAQMERNDPNNDPYSMANCVAKLQALDILSAPELLKTINYLKKDKMNREIFMTLNSNDTIVEFIKEAVSYVEY